MISFEIYVGRGFCDSEAASVARTLDVANDVLSRKAFRWRYISETPGLVQGQTGLISRAEPVVRDYDMSDILVVVGGHSGTRGEWLPRLRQMRRLSRSVLLLSEAATEFIRRTPDLQGPITTHWRDAQVLGESGRYHTLSTRLMERSGGVLTSAGGLATSEMIISLIAQHMTPTETAELGNRLLLQVVRSPQAEQPVDLKAHPGLTDMRLRAAVTLMEQSLESPLNINDLADQVDISTRHLERMFKDVFDLTPARFYKSLRVKRARALVEETQMPMVDVAIATGFSSSGALNTAIKAEYGMTATRLRARRQHAG